MSNTENSDFIEPVETVETNQQNTECIEETQEATQIEIPENVICKTSTDRKPINMSMFQGGYNNCLRVLHHSVKPIIGVVKYDFSNWILFPKNIAQAKSLAPKWSNSIEKKKSFSGKSVVIFFHLELKTIRVEVKEKKGIILETPSQVIGLSNQEAQNILDTYTI